MILSGSSVSHHSLYTSPLYFIFLLNYFLPCVSIFFVQSSFFKPNSHILHVQKETHVVFLILKMYTSWFLKLVTIGLTPVQFHMTVWNLAVLFLALLKILYNPVAATVLLESICAQLYSFLLDTLYERWLTEGESWKCQHLSRNFISFLDRKYLSIILYTGFIVGIWQTSYFSCLAMHSGSIIGHKSKNLIIVFHFDFDLWNARWRC